jgi:hypothetical protein
MNMHVCTKKAIRRMTYFSPSRKKYVFVDVIKEHIVVACSTAVDVLNGLERASGFFTNRSIILFTSCKQSGFFLLAFFTLHMCWEKNG